MPAGTGREACEVANGGCDPHAACSAASGERTCECLPGYAGNGERCVDVALGLDKFRWEMPCAAGWTGDACRPAAKKPSASFTLGGDPARTYELTLHFRGVVEQQSYTGGTADDYWYVGGRSAQGSYNIYSLQVSDPPQTHFLNAGKAGIRRVFPIDYVRTLRVKGGARVTLLADAQDGTLIANLDDQKKPIVVPGVPPAPAAFDGQFIQVDVVGVAAGEGTRVALSGDVLFETDSAELRPEARRELDAHLAKLTAEGVRATVEGHTDSQGPADHNASLSLRRAESVVAYLASKGVPRARLSARGRGASLPVASNDSPEGRARNRRVELVIQAP
ncbi:MAG: OmpA family protein [Myxococcales bacterium]|nr:OmpA family protein [Myxococcales bacterium]